MNENIRRIGRECGLYVEDQLPSGWPNENLIILETLAQEIAKECAKVSEDDITDGDACCTNTAYRISRQIKKHFGVEQ